MKPEAAVLALTSLPLIAAKGDAIRLDTDIGSILGYVVVGLIVGVLALLLVPGRNTIGFFGTLVIGILGAVLGGWLAGAFFGETEGVDWLASIGVAIVLVLLVRALSRRRPICADVSRRTCPRPSRMVRARAAAASGTR
jgi:uncharacterized membrane protein YeaQ/YmgE (transglycosylase-associated protein family)